MQRNTAPPPQCRWLSREGKVSCHQHTGVDACHAVWPHVPVRQCTECTAMAPEWSLVERRTTTVELYTAGLRRQLDVYDQTRMNGSTATQHQPTGRKPCSNRCSRRSWSTQSNAAERSRRPSRVTRLHHSAYQTTRAAKPFRLNVSSDKRTGNAVSDR